MNTSLLAAPAEIGGRYVVERELGHGATATVYLCRDRETGVGVAVKVLRLELAESVGAERFLREIRLTSGLRHPAIVPVLDSGAEGSLLYCVLPCMEGGTLRDVLRESRQLPIAEAVRIATTISGALAYAHAEGLIHRDIKPENILFSEGKAYLGDFGIARLLHATQGDLTTTTGVVRGTPAYMSPEQASGERNYDGRSDIYSLACVVYEMVSGMAPFTGPSAQSVLAQRFSTTARPMSVYRRSVSPELEQVVEKAMSLSPADRFATAREFSEELQLAATAPPAKQGWKSRRAMIAAASVFSLILVGAILSRDDVSRSLGFGTIADTSQVVVLPFEREADTQALGSVDAFVYEAFSAWRGLTVIDPFQVQDAVSRRSSASSVERDRDVSVALGAGRFIRGSVIALPGGGGWRVRAWLHQLSGREDTTLFSHSITIRHADLGSIDVQYAALAKALLLRGLDTGSVSALTTTTSLPALQHFTGGVAAVDEWDFARADSQFQRALEIDPEYRRAYLWQAQVRFWQRNPPDQWAPLAEKALLDTARLPERDQQLARALSALGNRDYDAACREYTVLRDRNQNDFAAWFGLGRCRDLDVRIVTDARSPTGWSYRSSYSDAVSAYRRAFEVLSLSHRSLERGAFEPLRELLFMRPSKLQAAVPPPENASQQFVGRLDWEDGRPILRPIPIELILASNPAAVPAGMRTALESQQLLFGSIAAAWSTALPSSAGAKEAVAVALEMRGDRAALDTLRVARRLAVDANARLRLAVAEAILRLKLADPADIREFRGVRALADSLMAANTPYSPQQAFHLAPLAAITGQCELASRMVADAPFSTPRGVSRDVIASADSLVVATLLGCAADPGREVTRLAQRIEASGAPRGTVNNLLLRTVQATAGADTALTLSFQGAGAFLLAAQKAAVRGNRDSVRAILSRVDSARERTGTSDVSPDGIFLEARALMAVGDTSQALARISALLSRLSTLSPGMLARPVEMGGLLRCLRLIASMPARSAGAAVWAEALRELQNSPTSSTRGGTTVP